MANNYRIDVFFRKEHYKIEFPEYWLAMKFANAICDSDGVESVYLLERVTDKSFDVVRRVELEKYNLDIIAKYDADKMASMIDKLASDSCNACPAESVCLSYDGKSCVNTIKAWLRMKGE